MEKLTYNQKKAILALIKFQKLCVVSHFHSIKINRAKQLQIETTSLGYTLLKCFVDLKVKFFIYNDKIYVYK